MKSFIKSILFCALIYINILPKCCGFGAIHNAFQPPKNTQLFGLKDWRSETEETTRYGKKGQPVLLLPFPSCEGIFPGQVLDIVFKHGKYFDLLQDSVDMHNSIIGMALMSDDGLMGTMILCHIEDFDVNAGFRGKITISASLRALARAHLVELTQTKPYMVGLCTEVIDDPLNREQTALANDMADQIEYFCSNKIQNEINKRNGYKEAYQYLLPTYLASQDKEFMIEGRSTRELYAVSWSAFALVSDQIFQLSQIVASRSLYDRLRWGLESILVEKCKKESPEIDLLDNDAFQ